MKDEEIMKKREQAEAFFRSRYPRETERHLSDFGAYCVEQWLTGRDPRTSYHFLAVDFLRSFAHRTRPCGDSSLDRSPGRISLFPEADVELRLGGDSAELGRFVESSSLRDPRLPERSRIVLILYYEWGFNLKEIGDLFRVSESRASQMLSAALLSQKERIQADDTSLIERQRQLREQEALSREIQERLRDDPKASEIMERIRSEKGAGVGSVQIEEILKTIEEIGTFTCESF